MSGKRNIILYQLTLILLENDYISAQSMSKILGISEKNVRNKLEEINSALIESKLGYIVKVPRKGVKIHYKEENKDQLRKYFENYSYVDFILGEERLYIYLRILLSNYVKRLTVTMLSEMTYDSNPICRRNLQICCHWLSLFNIELLVKRNYGIIINSNEENKRLAIKHLVINDPVNSIENSIELFAKGINFDLLKKCINHIESEWNFKFTEESYNTMLLYVSLSITRCDSSTIELSKEEEEIVVRYNEYNLAQSLFREINQSFGIIIPENEIKFFAIQLLCSKMINNQDKLIAVGLYNYDKKLKEFVCKIISVVSDILNIDLSQDTELYNGLLAHIRPTIFRLKFEKHSTNNLTSFIQEQYKQTYRVSWALSTLFEEYYDIKITSSELSYITLYIQSSLERMEKPLNIALVTELGMGLNQMFCNRIKLSIPRIDKIAIFSFHEFKRENIKEVDLVITTSKLDFDDEKIIQIKSLLNNYGLDELRKKIESIRSKQALIKTKFDASCHYLFNPNLILIKPKVNSKTDLIKLMAKELLDNGYVTKKYLNSVMEREGTVSTYIGNGVAIPHGFQIFVNESRVVVATLNEAIDWNKTDKVRVVFMLALRIYNAYESKRTQLFYQGFLNLIETDKDVEKILNMNREELYRYLVK